MSTKRLSLAQQIVQLEDVTPIDIDPEDIYSREIGSNHEENTSPSATREHYVDVGTSAIRKMHESISDPKYEGVRMTRKQLMEDSEGEESGIEEDGTGSIERDVSMSGHDEDVTDDREPSESESGDEDEDKDEDEAHGEEHSEEEDHQQPTTLHQHTLQNGREPLEGAQIDLPSTFQKKRDEDIKKGKAVSRQIEIWDTLLDARIRLQKSVNASQRLPVPSEMEFYMKNPECQKTVLRLLDESSKLTEELFDLQENLLFTNDILTPPPRKRRKVENTDSIEEYESYLVEASQEAADLEQASHPYLLQTISKWSAKIQAVAPSVLLPSNRGTFMKGSQQPKSAVQLIDEALAEPSKLLSRIRLRRGANNRIGYDSTGVDEIDEGMKEDPEIFDDTDFYQKLLKDIIDSRGNGNGGTEDWMVIQKQKKAKKKVDTKASKGRKIRYEVHEKLQNFMVPVPIPNAWHEEQVDELFASLLGKGYEDPETGDNLHEEHEFGDALKDGFRIFS